MNSARPAPRRVAFFTIGESPRNDVVPAMSALLGAHVQIDEFGALDALDDGQREALAPREGQHCFATRLRDGGSITLDKHATEERLAHVMREADEAGYDVLVPLCTGTALPQLRTFMVEPQQLVDQTMVALARHARKVGAIVPLKEQLATFHLAEPLSCELQLDCASPYENNPERAAEAFGRAGRALADCDFIVMHCMGYTEAMRHQVAQASGRPTLLSNHIVAHTLGQILA